MVPTIGCVVAFAQTRATDFHGKARICTDQDRESSAHARAGGKEGGSS